MIEDCHVEEVLTEKQQAIQNDRVTGAVTPKGTIKCDVFINCTGMVINQKTKLLDRFFFFYVFSGQENLAFKRLLTFEYLHKHVVNSFLSIDD